MPKSKYETLRSELKKIYQQYGPEEALTLEKVPPASFARMTNKQVNEWDFPERFVMRRIAKLIS